MKIKRLSITITIAKNVVSDIKRITKYAPTSNEVVFDDFVDAVFYSLKDCGYTPAYDDPHLREICKNVWEEEFYHAKVS